ncbi:MAG: hypothetical protein JEY94_10660 [Melioribacteraceae bacterium]|nr:hypothetical protein [Melioribacteraceae bacterium]
MNYALKIISLLFFSFLIACTQKTEKPRQNEKNFELAKEVPIQEIKLKGEIAECYSEISSMAWHGDDLILMPQFPHKFSNENDGILWKININRIEAYLNGTDTTAITAGEIKFSAKGLDEFGKSKGSGYEGITFAGNKVYMTIEGVESSLTMGFLLKGEYKKEENIVIMDQNSVVSINSQTGICNFAEETILAVNENVLTIHEANGANLNKNPVVNEYNFTDGSLNKILFPNIEFKINDATMIDENNNFWVINYHYYGDTDIMELAEDKIGKKYGIGKTHSNSERLERLVELNYSKEKITITQNPSIQLELDKDPKVSRNWEGIVRYKDKGFLIVTDYYPGTIFAFVPYSKSD